MKKNNNITNRLAELVERQVKLQDDVQRAKFALRDRLDKELTKAYANAGKALAKAVKPQVNRLNQIFMELNPDAEYELRRNSSVIDSRISTYASLNMSPRLKSRYRLVKDKKAIALNYKIKDPKEYHYDKNNQVPTDLFPAEGHPRYEEAKALAIHIRAEHMRYYEAPGISKLTDLIAKLK